MADQPTSVTASLNDTVTESEESKKHCRMCYALMPISARKCTVCQSYQDWQRYLSGSSVVLSLLVALVSVLTFALPIWKHQFYTPRNVSTTLIHSGLEFKLVS